MLVLALIGAFLGGIIWLGRSGRDHLQGQPRYEVAFAEIECQPPPIMTREKFLHQAHYYARLPERLNLLDEELPGRLRTGFAKHPWVEKVEDVEIVPPNKIVVKVTYRTPVLAIKHGGSLRVVDGNGVLLPKDAPSLGLPIYEGDPQPPAGLEGTRWGDPNVEAAARKLKK